MKWTIEEINKGIELINSGKNFVEVAEVLNKSQNSVTKKFNRLGFKSGYILSKKNGGTIYNNLDWTIIQEKHDSGYSYNDLIVLLKLTPLAIKWGKDNDKLVFRSHIEGVRLARSKGLYPQSNKVGLARYRQLCEFKFSLKDYKDKFDFKLIEQFGWYKAKNRGDNLGGVSRDHMYSVSDGFKNNIDPKFISHPANCSLVLQTDNSKKKGKSSITLEELIERINNW
jgi:hypothetical protein